MQPARDKLPNMRTLSIPTIKRMLLLAGLLLSWQMTACSAPLEINPPAQPEPSQPITLHGVLLSPGEPGFATGRQVVLCQLVGEWRRWPTDCLLSKAASTSDPQGQFAFENIAPGTYFILYDSGLSDLDAGLQRWGGQVLRPGDWPWIRDDFLGIESGGSVNIHAPESLSFGPSLSRTEYGVQTLLLGNSPFILAHEQDIAADLSQVEPIVVEVKGSPRIGIKVPIARPFQPDYSTIRQRIGPLNNHETQILAPELVARWEAFLSGDDANYSDTDLLVIESLRSGKAHAIGNTRLDRIEIYEGDLVKRAGYVTTDHQTGAKTVVGWLSDPSPDNAASRVVETSTGYALNVCDGPGEWIEQGPEGEQFYHYGFSYYRHWRRILPDPIITLAESFRTQGATHVRANLDAYQAAALDYNRGDMTLIDWDERTPDRVANWLPSPSAPPFVLLPDSGTVDVRRERFLEALATEAVVVDEASVARFLSSDIAQNGYFFTPEVTHQQIVGALSTPYRSGHLFNDLEAAIILAATYGGEGPLTIRIGQRFDAGVRVPRQGKEIVIAAGEVADVILGYPGTLNARWPHEMAHVIDFRDDQNTLPLRPANGSRCEPIKYMMEFMWWVQRYPYDAPDADWMPVGSGMTLARLLTGEYPNSGC